MSSSESGEASPQALGDGQAAGPLAAGPGGDTVLECRNVSKTFGSLVAVSDVSVQIPVQGVFGLCGLNGAGKSTLFNLLAGSMPVDTGEVIFRGQDVTSVAAAKRARMGLARTWQLVRLAGDRTVLDNVASNCIKSKGQPLVASIFRTQVYEARLRARDVLSELGMLHLHKELTGNLTLEAQRLTELARALAADPAIVLADEPASGLSGGQRRVLAETLTHLGTTRAVFLVEHDLELLERISQYMWAMLGGRLAFSGVPEEFDSSPAQATLRGTHTADLPTPAEPGSSRG
jgi:ABC-type branched-subunit amino acid transport system ATPase component